MELGEPGTTESDESMLNFGNLYDEYVKISKTLSDNSSEIGLAPGR
jgi:hypothetical protein